MRGNTVQLRHTRTGARRQVFISVISALAFASVFVVLRHHLLGGAILAQDADGSTDGGLLKATHSVRIQKKPSLGQFVWQRPTLPDNTSWAMVSEDRAESTANTPEHSSSLPIDNATKTASGFFEKRGTLISDTAVSSMAAPAPAPAPAPLPPLPAPQPLPPSPSPSPPPSPPPPPPATPTKHEPPPAQSTSRSTTLPTSPLSPQQQPSHLKAMSSPDEGRGQTFEIISAPNTEESYPGLRDAIDRFFVTDDVKRLDSTIANIRALHATYPPDKPRAAVFILAYALHCGVWCESPNARRKAKISGCTQRHSIANLVLSLNEHLFHSNEIRNNSNYPVVIFHEDWTAEDMAVVEANARSDSPVYWQKIKLNEDTLPSYVDDREVALSFLRKLHPNHNVSLPNPNLHGYGYRQMCRFFSGLIFHSPVLTEFDYYMRLDGGDSRIRGASVDPFRVLQDQGMIYGYRSRFGKQGNDMMALGHSAFVQAYPDVSWNKELLQNVYNLGSKSGYLFYNNFEVVDMRPYRSPLHWAYFKQFDTSGEYMCGAGGTAGNGCRGRAGKKSKLEAALGDADFRTLATAMLIKSTKASIKHFTPNEVKYVHPVPNWCAK